MSAHMTVQNQGDAGFVVLDRNGNFYARTYSSVDASLIAAAPRMLETLRLLIRTYDEPSALWDAARAILRDVEGESNG